MQNVSSSSEVFDALSVAATLLARRHIFAIQIQPTASGRQALVRGQTTCGQSLYAEIVIDSSTDEESESGGSQKA